MGDDDTIRLWDKDGIQTKMFDYIGAMLLMPCHVMLPTLAASRQRPLLCLATPEERGAVQAGEH